MKIRFKVILGILTCLGIILYWVSNITEGEYYKQYSPDGQYSMYASKNKYFNINTPFSKFGDEGGKVHLYDELENKLVSSASISMISNVKDHFFWSEDELYSKGKTHIKLPRRINPKTINKHEKSIHINGSRNIFLKGKHYKISKSDNKLIVRDENNAILLKDIKYISRVNNGFQVLNHDTQIEYYDFELNKLEESENIKNEYLEFCGNITTYGLKIEENEKDYVIKKAIGFTNYDFKHYISIDSVDKTKVKDIYFLNKKRELSYDENSLKKEYIIIDFGTYFGILSNEYGIEYFDSIDIRELPIKVMRNNLYGYYNITSTVYLELAPFEFNLARFKDEKNRKGYIDINGNTYYK